MGFDKFSVEILRRLPRSLWSEADIWDRTMTLVVAILALFGLTSGGLGPGWLLVVLALAIVLISMRAARSLDREQKKKIRDLQEEITGLKNNTKQLEAEKRAQDRTYENLRITAQALLIDRQSPPIVGFDPGSLKQRARTLSVKINEFLQRVSKPILEIIDTNEPKAVVALLHYIDAEYAANFHNRVLDMRAELARAGQRSPDLEKHYLDTCGINDMRSVSIAISALAEKLD